MVVFKKIIPKPILIILGITLLILFSYQFFSSKSLVGEWFVFGNSYNDQNHWVIQNDSGVVINTHLSSKLISERYKIEKSDSGTYKIVSIESQYEDELGFIKEYKKDTISFSFGAEFIRVKPTKTELTIDQVRELFLNSTIEIDYKYKDWIYTMMYNEFEVKSVLFPSNELNRNGSITLSERTSTTQISKDHFDNIQPPRQGVTNYYSSLSEPWKIYSVNGMFVLRLGYYDYVIKSFVINEITDSSFSGNHFYDGNFFPYSAKILNRKPEPRLTKLRSQIVETNWNIVSSNIIDLSLQYRRDYSLEELERTRSFDEILLTARKSDLDSNAFSFNFTNEGEIEIKLYSERVESMNWRIAPNSEFLFLYFTELNGFYYMQDYIEVNKVNDRISKLSFNLPIYLQFTDSTYRKEIINFELIPE